MGGLVTSRCNLDGGVSMVIEEEGWSSLQMSLEVGFAVAMRVKLRK